MEKVKTTDKLQEIIGIDEIFSNKSVKIKELLRNKFKFESSDIIMQAIRDINEIIKYNPIKNQNIKAKVNYIEKLLIRYYNKNLGKSSKKLDFQMIANYLKGKDFDFLSFS
ncbi:MAG: hypothetical protein ACFFDB_00195 [Promethearchaeota archaeon]